jgi:hypothetical protein
MLHTPIERFLKYIEVNNDGCWDWTGGTNEKYGIFRFDNKKLGEAHRFSYEFFKDIIPEGLEIHHLCNNHKCVNPEHLEIISHLENIKKGPNRHKTTHCPNGHFYSPENTRPTKGGSKVCKICERENGHKRYIEVKGGR